MDMEFIVGSWMESTDDGRMRLLGQRCEACGTVYFPKSAHCKKCSSGQVVEYALGPEAELHSFAVDRLGTFVGKPHLVGQVRFSEGAFAQGYIDASIDEPPSVGSTVDLVPFEITIHDEPTVTYAFRGRGV
jgi:uncharacterized OB-fold protein